MAKREQANDGGGFWDKAKRSCGCILLLILVPALGLIAVFYAAQSYQQEWAAAQPENISDAEWESKRALCETASLGAAECGATPTVKVKELSRAATERRRQELCAEDARAQAISEAKDAVRAHLKAPSSAKFVGQSIRAVQKDCDWTVTGQVDAQNAFGANLRSSFRVQLRRAPEDLWIPMSVRVD